MNPKISFLCAIVCLTGAFLGCGGAYKSPSVHSGPGFQQTNLVSDVAGNAAHTDPSLINPWGIAFMPGQSFFIADNKSGAARVYDATGTGQSPSGFVIPPPTRGTVPSAPTGVVFNPIAEDFVVRDSPAQFVFATEDGTISTWSTINGSFPTSASLAVDESASGAVYKGLAILTPDCCREFLALTDFHDGLVATFGVAFERIATLGTFTDPDLPRGYAPFNIQQIGTEVFVTYAVQDDAKHDPVVGPGNGIVDVFDQEGVFLRRFASNGPLNAPWGVVQASSSFGPFSNDILIGNFGDGTINAFDPATGNFLGQLTDGSGKVIVNPGVWALVFRNDGGGDRNTLYFSAGASNEKHGLFSAISFHN